MAGRSRASVDADVRPNRRRAFPASLVECRWRDGNRILHNHGHGTRHPSYSFRRRRCRAVHDRGGYFLPRPHPQGFLVGLYASLKTGRDPPLGATGPPPSFLFVKPPPPPPPPP